MTQPVLRSQPDLRGATVDTNRSGQDVSPPPERAHSFLPRRLHRPKFLKWLRRTHAWLGLWGAVLGLLFGFTGILLNHRAVMKIPLAETTETEFQVPLSHPLPVDAPALARVLQEQLALDKPASRTRVVPARTVQWKEGPLEQPEQWNVTFANPRFSINAEYLAGNQFVQVKRADANFFAWLNRLHHGTGVGVGWILLADTIGGAMMVLAMTGFLLWSRLQGPRLLALGLVTLCLTLTALFAVTGW
jgi:hypothetical protein